MSILPRYQFGQTTLGGILAIGLTSGLIGSLAGCAEQDNPYAQTVEAEVSEVSQSEKVGVEDLTKSQQLDVAESASIGNADVIPKNSETDDSKNWQPNTVGVRRTEPASVNRHALEQGKEVAEAIEISKARVASKSPDICPKLLEKVVDSNSIVRSREIMRATHCDYFLFPEVGDTLAVGAVPKELALQVTLIAPVWHDFIEGDYVAQDAVRHDIRVARNTFTDRSTPINYDMSVTMVD